MYLSVILCAYNVSMCLVTKTGCNYTVLQYVSALSGRQLIHLYIHLLALLIFLPTLANVLFMREVV
jgi:hypothetical protein